MITDTSERPHLVFNGKNVFSWLFSPYYSYDHTWTIHIHNTGVIMSSMASQITSLFTVQWTVYSGADQRKHQSSASLAFERGIHRWPVNSQHKCPETRKMFPFDDVIMKTDYSQSITYLVLVNFTRIGVTSTVTVMQPWGFWIKISNFNP